MVCLQSPTCIASTNTGRNATVQFLHFAKHTSDANHILWPLQAGTNTSDGDSCLHKPRCLETGTSTVCWIAPRSRSKTQLQYLQPVSISSHTSMSPRTQIPRASSCVQDLSKSTYIFQTHAHVSHPRPHELSFLSAPQYAKITPSLRSLFQMACKSNRLYSPPVNKRDHP